MINSEYSPYKVVHHVDRIKSVQTKGYCVPVTLQIAPTTNCNCKCYYCYVKEYNTKKINIKKERLFEFLAEAAKKGVKAVELTGGGEPTLYPYFDELVEVCYKNNLDVGLVTNGYRLKTDVLRRIKWLRVSIDTFDSELYKSIRKSSLPSLSCIKELTENNNVVTGASCVINKYNYDSLYDFAIKAKEIGFRNVWFKGIENSNELIEYKACIENELYKANSLADSSFNVFTADIFSRNDDNKNTFERCLYQHLTMMIYADGNVYYCCSLQGREKYAYANIYDKTFEDILLTKPELNVNDCPLNCFWGNKNAIMEYIMLKNPKHVNFI